MTNLPERPAQIVAIVDDDEAIRPALARLIRTLGYSPRTFSSAQGLLVELEDLDLAAVLTDIQMPRMNGYALVKELRRRKPDLPIILMTAYPSLSSAPAGPDAAGIEYMTKPLDDGQLERWLLRVIGEPPQF
jgi:FixJ family two-component response regulator